MEANVKQILGYLGFKVDSENVMQAPECTTGRLAGLLAASLLTFAITYICLWSVPGAGFTVLSQDPPPIVKEAIPIPKDELDLALEKASLNGTVIISVLNEAYVQKHGILDLFLRSLREGEGTRFLVNHLLLVAVDQRAFNSCQALGLHCYQLITEGVDFSKEVIYMSEDFIRMMWRRTLFLGEVLKKGYSFVFTDMDVMWVRNPFTKLSPEEGDLQISCDQFNGEPWDTSNPLNTGFYYTISNNRTTKLFEEWYEARNNFPGMKDQDVLHMMKMKGTFNKLGMRVRFLDTLYFSGFCTDSKDFREVLTVHANCCRSVKAKLADLTAIVDVWKRFNSSANALWPEHKACANSWVEDTKV